MNVLFIVICVVIWLACSFSMAAFLNNEPPSGYFIRHRSFRIMAFVMGPVSWIVLVLLTAGMFAGLFLLIAWENVRELIQLSWNRC